MRGWLGVLALIALARAEPPTWKVESSSLVRYELRTVKLTAGKETLGSPSVVTVYGHDLRDDGQHLPASLAVADLPVQLGLRTPAKSGPGRLAVALRDTVPVTLRGTAQVADDARRIVTDWTFASRGKPGRRDKQRLVDGTANVQAVFDPAQGHVAAARVVIAYTIRKLEPEPGKAPARVEKTYQLEFVSRRDERWPGQQADIDKAIEKGVAYLRTLQKEDATFEPHGDYAIGTTALGLLTLAACGASHEDPAVARGLAWLFTQEPEKNYDRAVALMAVDKAYTPPEEAAALRAGRAVEFRRDLPDDRRAWCTRVAQALESAAASPGSWDYKTGGGGRRFTREPDSSNSQYAVLGLRAAVRLGVSVNEQSWLGVVRHFAQHRERKGKRGVVSIVYEGEVQPKDERVPLVAGFTYKADSPHPWGAMTCAGIASLCIARDELRRARSTRLTGGVEREIEAMILGGWAWLDQHWAMDRHPLHPGGRWHPYYLYSLERAGLLSGVKRVGGKDWYLEGAAQLLARQHDDGSWREGGDKHVVPTCFALLFLKRATAPVTLTR